MVYYVVFIVTVLSYRVYLGKENNERELTCGTLIMYGNKPSMQPVAHSSGPCTGV